MDQSQLRGMQQNDQVKINSFREEKNSKKCFVVPYPAIENDKKGQLLSFFLQALEKNVRDKKDAQGVSQWGQKKKFFENVIN